MKEIIEWSAGNPGALNFLMEAFMSPNADLGLAIIISDKLKQCTTIRGTNAYVLWSDLCNRNIPQVAKLCKNCPNDILEDACNRQDYSGRELVQKYLDMD